MNTKQKPDFILAFLEKGKVIPANLLPDTADEYGLSFTYDAPDGENYIINMDKDYRFCAERFAFIEDIGWDAVEGYNHNEAKKLAYEAGIIKPR